MEFRKIVPMNLFTEKKWRHRCRERTVDIVGIGEARIIDKVTLTYMHFNV